MSDGTVKPSDYKRVPLADVLAPQTGREVLVDYWWVVTPQNEVLFYKGRSPQCNASRRLVESLIPEIPGCEARLLPLAYIPHRCP